jgi:hypothetical protein
MPVDLMNEIADNGLMNEEMSMFELLQRLVALRENRDPITNKINWDYVDADAYRIVRHLYEELEDYVAAFEAAADMIEEN